MANGLLRMSISMRRKLTSPAIESARAHFDDGVEVVYLSVEEDGSVHVTLLPPNRKTFLAAHSLLQVERFVAELARRTA